MALKPCPECNNEISTKAESCPHCGKVLKKKSSCGCLTLLVAGFAFFIVYLSYSEVTSSTRTRARSNETSAPEPIKKQVRPSVTKADFAKAVKNSGVIKEMVQAGNINELVYVTEDSYTVWVNAPASSYIYRATTGEQEQFCHRIGLALFGPVNKASGKPFFNKEKVCVHLRTWDGSEDVVKYWSDNRYYSP